MLLGKCNTGGLINLHFISSNVICCSFSHINCSPFLFKSYIGFNHFCSLGQNMLKIYIYIAKLEDLLKKVTQDKRVVTYFRHLNVRRAKNNLVYPLLKDTFSVLGSSRCKVLSVLDLKDALHSLRLSENSKRYCGILPDFGSASYLYQRIPVGLNISSSIWQSYIKTILECLQSRKYCKAIMNDLLLFTLSKIISFEIACELSLDLLLPLSLLSFL